MSLVSDTFHDKKLKKYNINIKTKYIVGNNILERNTNGIVNDDIKNGVRCEKDYYIGNKLLKTEKLFDTRIEYTFISKEEENKDFSCPNCVMPGKVKNFIDGFPYCRSKYNIDYTDKDLGSKYHYDRVLRNTNYRIITAFIDLIVSLFLTYIFGASGTVKTRSIYQKHSAKDICRITNYRAGKGINFDGYTNQNVLVFEEFNSQIPIEEMLNYLDIYPLNLPARYNDRTACYQTVYITSNIPLSEQYKNVQKDRPETWKAFLRRIHKVLEYTKDGTIIERSGDYEHSK